MAAVEFIPEVIESEQWGDYVNPLGFLTDDPNFGFPTGPISLAGDRDEGKERRLIENEVQLAAVRGQARVLSWSTPFGTNILKSLRNYTIGTGFEYVAQPARRAGELPSGLLDAVQWVIDEFLDANNWCGSQEREGEILARTERDGESFVSLGVDQGHIVTRLIDPEQVVEPQNPRGLEDALRDSGDICHCGPVCWTWGIATPEDDVERSLGYHVQWTGSSADYEWLSSERVEHLKLNTDSNVKRGISGFFPVMKDLEREAKLRRNTVEGAALQAAIAWVQEEATGTTSSQASGQIKATSTFGQGVAGGGTRQVQRATYNPGTIIRLSAGKKFVPGPMGSERIPNFVQISGLVLRSIGANWQMPEYMVSGDASNANYASTSVAESPFVKARESDQRFYSRRYRNIVWKALKIAWRLGAFSRFGVEWSDIERLVEVVVTPPAIASRNRSEETTRNVALAGAGLLSKRTWAQREELDFEEEQRNLASEPKPEPPSAHAIESDAETLEDDAALATESLAESVAVKVTDKLFSGLRSGEQWKGYP